MHWGNNYHRPFTMCLPDITLSLIIWVATYVSRLHDIGSNILHQNCHLPVEDNTLLDKVDNAWSFSIISTHALARRYIYEYMNTLSPRRRTLIIHE